MYTLTPYTMFKFNEVKLIFQAIVSKKQHFTYSSKTGIYLQLPIGTTWKEVFCFLMWEESRISTKDIEKKLYFTLNYLYSTENTDYRPISITSILVHSRKIPIIDILAESRQYQKRSLKFWHNTKKYHSSTYRILRFFDKPETYPFLSCVISVYN